MIYINHRINTVEQLAKVPKTNGAEIDIRYHENELVLHHDPFQHHINSPQKFRHFLESWHHEGPLILNVKTEGVEKECIKLMRDFKVKNWFFLDLSMPYFCIFSEHAKNGRFEGFSPENLAVRFSEKEPIEYALSFSGKASWVWVDCFSYLPMYEENYNALKQAGFKICLVSPELQSHSMDLISEFRAQCGDMEIDAVCTKRPDLWGQNLPENVIKQLERDYPFA